MNSLICAITLLQIYYANIRLENVPTKHLTFLIHKKKSRSCMMKISTFDEVIFLNHTFCYLQNKRDLLVG